MSDIAKWALLVAGIVALIAMIVVLPFVDFINLGEFEGALNNVVEIAGSAFQFARGLTNNFLLPFGRTMVSGLMFWFLGKWAIMVGIKIVAWAYHFIFK